MTIAEYRKFVNKGFVLTLTILSIIWIYKQRSYPLLQIRTLTVAVITYLIWAAIHHKLDKSLTLEVYIEYLLTATLALILLMGVLL